MKKYILEFLKRGAVSAAGGPVILAIIFGILGKTGAVSALTPGEVSLGILSVTLMAFIAAGITMIYTIEQLPLITAILIHGGVLYLDYLIMYLLNSWIPRDPGAIGLFTVIFVVGYALVWLCVYLSIRAKANRINKKLNNQT